MRSGLDQLSIKDRIQLYTRTARRAAHRYGLRPSEIVGRLDPRPIFVVGCPRSGTTFTASALGSVAGFADLGEVNRLKAVVPELYRASRHGRSDAVVDELRSIMTTSQRVAMAARRRAIEQTPESTYLIPEIARAFPRAHFVHLVRDGRDVVSSLIERGWLAGDGRQLVRARAGGQSLDDAGHPFGGYSRFWVESGRETEFENASEARRCAWAWRRYVTVAQAALGHLDPNRVTTVRYEDLVANPATMAARIAADLDAMAAADDFTRALSAAHPRSVGKHAERLSSDQLDEIEAESGALLDQLGYRTAYGAS